MFRPYRVLGLSALVLVAARTLPPEAPTLRDRGVAELENDKPADAEETFRRLIEIAADDPLGHANLAVATLRQQKHEVALAAIDRALEKAPERADLLSLRGEILVAAGRAGDGLAVLARAASAAPDDPEAQFALIRHAATLGIEPPAGAVDAARARLVRLRPENLVVLLEEGRAAIAAKDRARASAAYLRVKELLWGAPPTAANVLDKILAALEAGGIEQTRTPAAQLENVLKVTAAYQGSLRELFVGIQAKPVMRFAEEPAAGDFGQPVEITFRVSRLDRDPSPAVALGDFDGDGRGDIARWSQDGARLELRLASGKTTTFEAPRLGRLLAVDLDNDGRLDLIGLGAAVLAWKGGGDGSLRSATGEWGLEGIAAPTATAFDFDSEGDLDLVLGGGKKVPIDLLRNALTGALERVGSHAFPKLALRGIADLAVTDLDRDGDLDLVAAHERGVAWLENLRQGEFRERASTGLPSGAAVAAIASADLDNDGDLDVVTAGEDLSVWRNRGNTRFERAAPLSGVVGPIRRIIAIDLDNDGRLDLAAAGKRGVTILMQRGPLAFERLAIADASGPAAWVGAADFDADGDLDLVAAANGLVTLENEGGNRNHWLRVQLRGLVDGSNKNNVSGIGATLEVKAGGAYQFREVAEPITHVGLGRRSSADLLRVVWINGVPQNRLQVSGNQLVVEEQMLKGSCPFLYAWDGERFTFVTDLLWGAPLGLPIAPGTYAASNPEELVRVDGAIADRGLYRLRVTEELWEAAYFDRVRLWVVDHPADVEVASNLRIIPGERIAPALRASRALRAVTAAWDGRGREVTERVRARDDVYADGFERSAYQGVAARPWAFTFDLGRAPAAPIRLHLDGWIFPADASLNLAVAQRRDLDLTAPRLEVEVDGKWRTLMADFGHPAGKTKTMVVDTPPLPPGSRRLRIVSSLWLAWDRVAWSGVPDDGAPVVRARLAPARAELRYRGFSAPRRLAPNAPHGFDYEDVRAASPWLPFAGRYTRYGDVRELVREPDDHLVVMSAGDEIALDFDAAALAPPPSGWRRTVFLESHGWDKDADRNTFAAESAEPLPFRAMTGYPFAEGESVPDDDRHREYVREWLTREVRPER